MKISPTNVGNVKYRRVLFIISGGHVGKQKKYWISVHEMLQNILPCAIPFQPEFFLLNIMPDIVDK